MSMSYWVCEGIGIREKDILRFVNRPKLMSEIGLESKGAEDDDIYSIISQKGFDSIAEVLYSLDKTNMTAYGNNGAGEYYFYFYPRYPWDVTEDCPKSYDDACSLIANTVIKICDMPFDQVTEMIEELYEPGCG